MGRVHGNHALPGASGAVGPVHHKRAEPKKKPAYKVVLEEIAGKKKLKTALSLREKPPPGYTFIPAGDPQLTNRCKKLAKDEQLTVFIVSTSKHPHEQLSTEVHRIGYHFPSIIVDQACTSLGVTLTQSGRVMQSRFAFIDDQGSSNQHHGRRPTKGKNKGKKRQTSPKLDMSLSQAVIDTTAREAIKDLFPNIPSKDQKEIVGRAFQKGKGLVGTVSELSLVRRAQLAVTAHIRHMYTNYDSLLRSMRWGEARQAVQQQCLDKLVQWRGDDDDDGEMADILQEVIVISDDEEDEDQRDAQSRQQRHGRSDSVEFISADAINTQAIDYAAARSNPGQGRSLSSNSDDGDAVTCLGHAPLSHGLSVRYNQQRLHEMGAHRHRMWEEAVDRRRKNPDMLYATDNRPPLSAPGSFGPDPYQAQQKNKLQTYRSLPAVHSFDRPSTYTRLIPLPVLDDQSSHGPEPHRGEKRIFTDQVPHVSQQQQLSPLRSVDEPSRAFHTKEATLSYPERPVYGNQLLPVRAQYEDVRSVRSQKLSRESLDNHHSRSHSFHTPPRRHSELILPSIEGDLPDVRDQQPVFPHQHQGINGFTQRHADNGEMLRPCAFSEVRLNEEVPHAKRRRVNDQQPIDDGPPRTVLVPLHHGAEGYPFMTTGPAKAVYYENVPPSALDKRIIQLPPREARRYEDNQSRIQMMTHSGHRENRSVHPVPGEEYQPRHVLHEVSAQPQSPKRSVAFQSVYDQQSPTSFNVSVPSHREVLNQRPSSRHTSGVNKDPAPVFSDAYAARSRPQCFEDIGRDMRADFRNLEIDPRQRHDDDNSINENMNNGRHASSHAPGTGCLPRNFQTDLSMPNREGPRQIPIHDSSFGSSHAHHQYSIQNSAAGPSEWRVPLNAHLTPEQVEKATTNPFRGHSSASMARLAAVSWNPETHPWEAASMMHGGQGLPQTRANTGHTGKDNIRPRAQPYRNSGQRRRRLPGELVVLE